MYIVKHFVVLDIKYSSVPNQLETTVMVEEEKRIYQIKYGGWLNSINIPGELEKILGLPVIRYTKFISLIFSFLEENFSDFPVDLSETWCFATCPYPLD